MSLRVVFLGTPEFACPSLETLYDHRELVQLTAVVTQTDKPKGRGKKLVFSPVKELAMQHGTTVIQPQSLRRNEPLQQQLKELAPDIGIVASYGQIIPKSLLRIPRYGMINVHASLLPRWRGASPVAHAILHGDSHSGVSIMKVVPRLDAGPYLMQEAIQIADSDTTGSLTEKLAHLGAKLLPKCISQISEGPVHWHEQDETKVSYAPMLDKKQGAIDWRTPSVDILRAIRAYAPWPGAYTFLNGKQCNIWAAQPLSEQEKRQFELPERASAGSLFPFKKALFVATADGYLKITEIQLQGRKRMPIANFLAGMQQQVSQARFEIINPPQSA